MIIKEAIILAGGLGTRLRSAVPDLPKCMAPVNGRPFITYIIDYLQAQGVNKLIFALGYKHEFFQPVIDSLPSSLHVVISAEKEPLGTGGAIKLACDKASGENVLVMNGDTMFRVDIKELSSFHHTNKADCTLCLKPMHNFDRYGVVELDAENAVRSFKEKQFYTSGLINGGVYALQVNKFLNESLPEKFSFEKDYLEQYISSRKIFGLSQDEYFIDIGIPEDYQRAQLEFNNHFV